MTSSSKCSSPRQDSWWDWLSWSLGSAGILAELHSLGCSWTFLETGILRDWISDESRGPWLDLLILVPHGLSRVQNQLKEGWWWLSLDMQISSLRIIYPFTCLVSVVVMWDRRGWVVLHRPQHVCESWRTTWRSQFSCFIFTRVSEIELRSPGLTIKSSTFTTKSSHLLKVLLIGNQMKTHGCGIFLLATGIKPRTSCTPVKLSATELYYLAITS